MPKTLLDVQNEYENYKSQNPGSAVDLTSFAKQMDEVQGAPERQAAYDPHWYNKLNALVDRGFEATHLPDVTGAVGSGLGGLVDSAAGTHIQPTLETLGRDVPRMTAESLLTIPEVGSGAGIPAAGAMWANRLHRLGQIVGYGDAALKGYDQTGSPVGAAISAGSMGVANKLLLPAELGGIDVGSGPAGAVSKWLERGTPDFNSATMAARDALGEAPLVAGPTGLAGRLPGLVHAGTQVAAATGLNEATRQAEMSVGPNAVGVTDPARNPFTQENVASAVGGAAFFTPQIFQALKSRPVNSPKQTAQLGEWLSKKDVAAQESQGLSTPAQQLNVRDTSIVETSPEFIALLQEQDTLRKERIDLNRKWSDAEFTARDAENATPLSPKTKILRQQADTLGNEVAIMNERSKTFDKRFKDYRSNSKVIKSSGDNTTFGEQEDARDPHQALYGILRTSLDAAAGADAAGNTAEADTHRANALATIDEMASGRYGTPPPEMLENVKSIADSEAMKAQATSDPAKFGDFVSQVKGIVDTLNEGNLKFQDELASREETLNRNDKKAVAEHDAWVASQQANKGKSWHPEARDPSVLDRLWKSGDLQPLTPEWLQKEYNASFDQSGNPQFATQVVAQKVANYALDHINAALERESVKRKAVTEFSPAVQKYNDVDMQFAKALTSLPPEVRDAVVQRSVELRRYGNFQPGQAERMGITEGTRVKPSGEVLSPYLPWQKAVINAANSYKPETGAILLRSRGQKGYSWSPIETLVKKDQSGKYVWEPNEQTVAPALGGKSSTKIRDESGKTVKQFETNIENLPTKEGQDSIGAHDEEEFKAALGEASQEPVRSGDFGSIHLEGDVRPADETKAMPAEATKGENALGERLAEKSVQLNKTLDSLTDAQVWNLVRQDFKLKAAGVKGDSRAGDIKLAIRAAMDTLAAKKDQGLGEYGRQFLEQQKAKGLTPVPGEDPRRQARDFLRRYFQSGESVFGASGKLEPHEERLARIVKKLLDPKTVERAKTEGPKAQFDLGPRQEPVTLERLVKEGARLITTKEESQEMFKKYGLAFAMSSDKPHESFGGRLGQYWADDNGKLIAYKEGQSKPKSEGVSTEPIHTLVNEPREGAFVGDVAQTFRAFVDKTLGRAGYSGTSKEFFTEVAVSLARNLPNLDLYRLVGKETTHGMAGIPGMTEQPASERGKLGLNFDRKVAPGQEFAAAQQLLATLAHEITHMHGYIRDGLIPKPDAYSDEMGRTYTNLEHLVTNLTPDEREGMMNVLNESLPASFRKLREDGMKPLGTMDPDEFLAEVTSKVTLLLANDTASGRAVAMESLDYAPTELREFAQNTFRTVNDTLTAMQDALKVGKIYTANTDPFILDKGFQAVIGSAKYMSAMRDADRQLTLARSAISSMSPKGMNTPPPRITDSVWFTGQKDLAKYQKDVPEVSPTSIDAVNEVHKQVFSPTAYDAAHTPNAFARWFYPFSNLMVNMERQGIPLARPVLDMVLSLEPGISRLYSGMMSEFMKRNTDGSVDFNQQNPLVHAISTEKSGPTRDAINAVSKWQQDNKTQSMFIVDQKSGTIMANPDAKGATEKWNAIRSQLSKESQQLVMGASVSLDKANQLAGGYLVKHIADANTNIVATYLMAANKGMTYDVAQAKAAQITDAYLTKNQMALSAVLPEDQLQALDRLLVGNNDGLLPKFLEVKTLLENRPGFRSESLPHDWIIKYKDGDATRYASAPTEKQAEYVANRLRASGKQLIGEILNKRDYNSMQEFDHPDAILAKVAETENFVWQRFVGEMTTQHGEELGKELTEGFSPVAQSLKDFGTAGLNKFLRERRQLVDRENFDYVDGTFAYLDRLSKSLGIRTVQQQVRLILNDPRARLLPSFQKLVREHVSEMMQPTSRAAQQLKTFVSTNFLGMNIGGALVNGTQSISTLVPHLITGVDTRYVPTGGVAKAWKDMFHAMGKAVDYTVTKDWERTASGVRDIDPTKWSADQSQAALYKRHLEGGGINQTVVDDLMYGRDKNMLMNAKFGSGDYGPVPTSKLVGDKMYMASQMMMYLYKGVEHFNAKTAFLSGIKQGHELGLRGNELYDYGVRMQALATFGGGRANAPGVAGARWAKSGENGARSAVGLVNSLQQYGYGVLSMYAQLGKDSIGRSSGLNAVQVRQAQKAFGTMLMTQIAVAGALGLPFVGASLTLLEKVFGIPANQAVRQGLASLGGDDSEAGATIAETALNGGANQLSGLDLSSRLGTSSLFGTSSYRGFNVQDMVGPAGSIIGNMANALNYFAQGKPAEAFHELVPQAFKNAVELSNTKAKYGDAGFRDAAGNLMYTPTPGQSTAYALGFRPKELSQKRQMQSMLTAADLRSSQRNDNQLDVAAQALSRGDSVPTQRLVADMRSHDQTLDPRDIMRQVMDRGVAMQSEKDLLASGSRYDEQERLDIAKTFGADVNTRRSEVDLQNLRMQMAQLLGDPRVAPNLESYKQAAIVDSLVQQQGMPRSQAVRLLGFLHGKY